MSLFTAPSNAAVLDDTGLRIEEINPLYTSNDALTDITEKIVELTGAVENRIICAASPQSWPFDDGTIATAYPSYDATARTAYTERQKGVASLAVKLRAVASVFRRAGQMNKLYTDKANEYEAQAGALLTGVKGTADTGLLGQLAWVSGQIAPPRTTSTFSVAPRRVDGYSGCGTETEYCDPHPCNRRWRR